MSHSAPYRGRIAPSPTGLLHLGHAATFWVAFRRSVAVNGTLVLRMEDLDPQRSKPEFARAAMEDLGWLNIGWQEGPDLGGAYGPYLQSQRQPLYAAALRELLARGFVFPCSCSRKDLARIAQAPHADEPMYPGTCRATLGRHLSVRALGDAMTGVNWRFRVTAGEAIEFHDGYFGRQRFVAGEDFGDFLIWRKDGVPAYQLAVAVDDAAMQITEVVRGADLLKSTARQILLCRALGLPQPGWHHCRLVTDAHGQRLAKRHDALSLRELRASGVESESLLKRIGADPEPVESQRGPNL